MIYNKTECYDNIHDYADYIQRYTFEHVIFNIPLQRIMLV